MGSQGQSTLDASVDGSAGSGSGAPVLASRKRPLATGRALAGGFLVAVAAVIVFAAVLANAGRHSQRYVIATQAIPTGSIIGPADLTTLNVTLPSASEPEAFRQTSALVGRTVVAAISPGELVEQSMLVPPGTQPSTRPVSVGVDPSSLGGLSQGSAVDVLATTGTASTASVSVVMRGAVLIAVNNPSSNGLSGSSTSIVTLGVDTLSEVEAVVQASQSGTISLVAAEPSDGVGPGSGSPSGS